MDPSGKTFSGLWVESGGKAAPAKVISSTAACVISKTSQPPGDILKFYQDQGFDTIAKEAGIIETVDELSVGAGTAITALQQQQQLQQQQLQQQQQQLQQQQLQQQQQQIKNKTIKLIAVPVSSTALKNTPFKVVPRMVYVSAATPLNLSVQQPLTVAKPITLPARTVTIQTPVQQQQQKHAVMPKVIQLITTPTYTNPPQQHHGAPVWTVNKRPQAVSISAAVVGDGGGDYFDSKRRKGAHGGKGLRHFAMKVCEKVQKKGVTSYNEVADELVNEFGDPCNSDLLMSSDQQFDQKNIRRRVYDALNVLMAMNIISKEKKEIKWIGLPTNSAQECQNLEIEKQRLVDRIQQKTQQLNELILQQIAFKNLVQRNKAAEEQSNGQGPTDGSAIQLPFILVNTDKKTVIDCSISSDKYEYLFNFDQTFEIHDDIEVLKRMGLAFGLEKGQCSRADLNKAVKMVPKALESYVHALANSTTTRTSQLGGASVTVKVEPDLIPVAGVRSRNPDQMLDAEVAMTTGSHQLLSRQSSSMSSVRDSPDYSDDNSGIDSDDN